MLKKILIAFATVVALVLAIGLALPSKYRVERSTTVQASPEALHAYVANLQRWQEWAPWNAKRYPGSQWMFGGPEVGVGAVRSWSGGDVGTGTLSLTQADPKTGVAYDMSVAQGRYLVHGRISFAPAGTGTRVTWVDEGDMGGDPLAHYLVPLIRSRLGGHMEEGLARLAKVVEANPLPVVTAPEPEPTPAPAPVVEAPAPSQPPVAEHPAPTVEGSQQAHAPVEEGSEVAAPPPAEEGSPASAPAEAAPTTAVTAPPSGEPAPASEGTAAPSGEPVPASEGTAAPSGEPAPARTTPSEEPAQEPVPASAPADASATPAQA